LALIQMGVVGQFLPFADPKAQTLYRDFERAVYQTLPSR
jgi:hypothetical protein